VINTPPPTPRLSSLELRKHLDGGFIIGVVAKRTYQIQRNGQCALAAEQIPLVEEPVMAENGLLDHDSDRLLSRELVDVVIDGHARVPQPSPAFRVGVQIGGQRREIAVFGERQLRLSTHGTLTLSSPEPIERVPLRWEFAFGGVDRTLLEELGDPLVKLAEQLGESLDPEQTMFAYPRNPHGRGYLIEASRAAVAATRLPLLEDPLQPLTATNVVRLDPELWPLAPRPMCPAWMPYVHFPRSAQTGLPIPSFDRDRIDLRLLPEVQERQLRVDALAEAAPVERRIDMGCAQAAAPGMRFREVSPGEAVEIQNVHPELPNWQWRLPLERPRMAYRIPHQPAEEMEAKMRSLFIQPEGDLLCVVWVGERRLQSQFTQEQLVRADYGMKWTG
jgi:hypothetical protein